MSRKKKIIIISIVAVCLIVGVIILLVVKNSKKVENNEKNKKKTEEVDCIAFTGGSYNLKFKTNGGNEIESMTICIACSPDSYKDIPVPTKEGDTFDGWYYDEAFKNKVSETSTGKIKPVEDIDKNGCLVGYKDITLYAKWNTTKVDDKKDEKKDDNKPSNSKTAYCDDGSKPSNGKCTSTEVIDATVSYTCNGLEEFNDKCIENSLTAIGSACPFGLDYNIMDLCHGTTNDSKDVCEANGGYFVEEDSTCSYADIEPTSFVCDGERAGMELMGDTCVSFIPMSVVYSCPDGYTLDGTKCSRTITTDAKYR